MSGPRRPDPPGFSGREPRRPGPPPPGNPSQQDTTEIPTQYSRRGPRPPVDPQHRPEAPQWWQQNPRPPPEPWYLALRREGTRPPEPPAPPVPAARDRQRAVGQGDRRRYSKRQLLIGAGLAAVVGIEAVVLALVLGKLGVFGVTGSTELDVNQAQVGVQQVLTDPINGYGRDNVTDVRCNNGHNPIVKTGSSFSCAVNVDGANRLVTVVFSDDAGTYEVDRPR